MRKQDKFPKEVHSQVLQDVSFRLDKTFNAFFAGMSRFPRFKRKTLQVLDLLPTVLAPWRIRGGWGKT